MQSSCTDALLDDQVTVIILHRCAKNYENISPEVDITIGIIGAKHSRTRGHTANEFLSAPAAKDHPNAQVGRSGPYTAQDVAPHPPGAALSRPDSATNRKKHAKTADFQHVGGVCSTHRRSRACGTASNGPPTSWAPDLSVPTRQDAPEFEIRAPRRPAVHHASTPSNVSI